MRVFTVVNGYLACDQVSVEPERGDCFAFRTLQFRARPLALLAEFFSRPRWEPVRRLTVTL